MFCSNCGKEIDGNAYVCIHCGALVHSNDAPSAQKEEKQRNNLGFGLGIAGFILSILSLVLNNWWLIAGIVSIVLSCVGNSISKKNGDSNSLGFAGMIIGIVSTAIWLLIIIIAFAAYGSMLY